MDAFRFKTELQVPTTPVKNQAQTRTCWSFASISLLEAEILRRQGRAVNLSEMYMVRLTYPRKARRYVRMHGHMAFHASGLAGDALHVLREFGLVPEQSYDGKSPHEVEHDHREMDAVLKAALDAVIQNHSGKLSKAWPKVVEVILDAYLGPPPEQFIYQEQTYTPKRFAESLDLRADDYVELTSYTHQPFYTWFSLDIPDNWSLNRFFNLPLEEFMEVLEHALEQGYSFVWDGDITEPTFSTKHGVAVLPSKAWDAYSVEERDRFWEQPVHELTVTQALRQEAFDNYTSTDDHLMHIIGRARDRYGTTYYVSKNSWGLKGTPYGGLIYLSDAYVRAKTISIMVNKNALPKSLQEKLGRG